jgi:uncharacterized protein (TIGR03083 family)
MSLPVVDTRFLFRPLCRDIVALLRTLAAEDWERPTLAGAWHVRDVVAHLLDTALRRLSFDRDGRLPPAPARPIDSDRDLVAFINNLNASWIRAAERLSPRVLTDLYASASESLSDFVESSNLDAPARFPVSWAGQNSSRAWLDIGREFTEVWHHAAQVRDAVGAAPFTEARWLHAVLAIAMHAIPHAYRDVPGRARQSLAIDIVGEAGGRWTLRAREMGWDIDEGSEPAPGAKVTMSDDTAWRLFFNALPLSAAQSAIRLEGDAALAGPLLHVRSVIV